MKPTIKRYSADFKAKVALEAIRGDLTLAALGSKHDGPADAQALRRDYTRPRLGCCCVAQHRRRPCRRPQINRKPLCTPSRPNLDPLVSLTPFPIKTSLSYLITISAYCPSSGHLAQIAA